MNSMSTLEMLIAMVYAFIGALGTLSILIFSLGCGLYIVRLGTERRIQGIRIMEWGVGLMVATILLVGVLHILE